MCIRDRRRPYTLADAVKATGLEAEPLEKLLDEMSYIGPVSYTHLVCGLSRCRT